jgi:hypothetical protein
MGWQRGEEETDFVLRIFHRSIMEEWLTLLVATADSQLSRVVSSIQLH